MVWVPAGTATIGRAYQTFPNADEQPAHNVAFDGYWIYKTEVSVAQYSQYQAPRAQPTWSGNTYPLVNVRWAEATQYASWAGAELPTEAQWEHAGRGAGNYLYPWGNDWNDGYAVLWQNTNVPTGAVPCGSTATDASGYGVLDMGGNVNEWCRDYYSNTAYSYATSLDSDTPANVTPTDNLGNDATITGNRVIRGGAYKNAFFPETDARLVNRMFGRSANYADVAGYYGYNDEVGFRCVVMPAM